MDRKHPLLVGQQRFFDHPSHDRFQHLRQNDQIGKGVTFWEIRQVSRGYWISLEGGRVRGRCLVCSYTGLLVTQSVCREAIEGKRIMHVRYRPWTTLLTNVNDVSVSAQWTEISWVWRDPIGYRIRSDPTWLAEAGCIFPDWVLENPTELAQNQRSMDQIPHQTS